jgi:hypothetical protein
MHFIKHANIPEQVSHIKDVRIDEVKIEFHVLIELCAR